MEIVLRVLQVFLAVGLIGVVLLQRSEGCGLGLGSGGGAGSFMSVRGQANFLTRATAILAALFMITCLVLALLAKPSGAPKSIFDTPVPAPTAPAPVTPSEAPAPQAPSPGPAAQAPALPVPVPGEQPNAGVTTNPLQTTPAPVAPAPAPAVPPAASAPAEPAPAAPATQPAPQPEKKAKKAKPHTSGQ